MDILSAFGGIGAAFGLSSSAGLNAYIPLLMASIATRIGWLSLGEPYDMLGHPAVMGVLAILLAIEVLVDKIPAVDSINDMVQTLIRPAAGAFLFAANANVITDVNPALAAVAGLMVAGTVHATKSTIRPAITTTTVGTGNWAVSILEDIMAVIISILALIIPVLGFILAAIVIIMGVRFYLKRKNKKEDAFAY